MVEDDNVAKSYGHPLPYDRDFRGPQWRNRSCTDVPCLLIFLLFLGGWGFIAHYALTHGDLNKLMVPTDSYNQKCGIDSQVLDKKFLFFFELEKCIDPIVPLTGCDTPQVCVKSCPTETFDYESMKNRLSLDELKTRLICRTEVDKYNLASKNDIETAIAKKYCAGRYVQSEPFLNRCIFSSQVCQYLPSYLSPGARNRRTIAINGSEIEDYRVSRELQSMALTQQPQLEQLQNERSVKQCRRLVLEETVIKEKMQQTDTRLAKLVGNMVAHFYNGTHDSQQMGEAIAEDIINSWFVVLMALCCTLFASLIFIALMRWLAAPILWFSIMGVLLGLIVAIYYSITEYTRLRNTGQQLAPNHSPNVHSVVKNFLQEQSTWLYLSIIICICFAVILLLVVVLRKRINIAIALTKEGSKAVSSVISTVFFPIFSWILFIVAIVYALAVGLYLGSIGEPSFRMVRKLENLISSENCVCEGPAVNYKLGEQCVPTIFQQNCYSSNNAIPGLFKQLQRVGCLSTSCSFVKIENPSMITWFIAYDVFGFLWLTFFISAFSDMVLAATFSTWYWTFKKKDVPFFTLTRAFRQTAFYHLGTLAFGSLLLAICRMIRLILEYIHAKLKKYDNTVTRAILCCMRCFFWLLESFLRFLNRNAYIMCAIHGKNFCSSAKDSFNLVMRNFLRVVTLDKVTDFLFFLSKVLLTGAAGAATYYFLVDNPSIIQLHYKAVPTTIVVIAAYLITSVFFGVYSMAVDTLFLCFLEDCERNDGSPEKPYYMSKQLMKILGKRNKLPKRNRERH